jgi:hypothetical protein
VSEGSGKSGVFDPLDGEDDGPPITSGHSDSGNSSKGGWTDGRMETEGDAESKQRKKAERPEDYLTFLSPSQVVQYVPPPGAVLIGDTHIALGQQFVIGGAPGVGKSRAGTALAVAGATGEDWFGLKVHRRFKTLILQNENGELRLKQEFGDLDVSKLEDFVRISPPPPKGIQMDKLLFRKAFLMAIESFAPDVILFDPWNAVARGSTDEDYQEAFEQILTLIGKRPDSPAVGIVAHTRKPRIGERSSGRSLLNLLAGSYVLGSIPRAAFVVQAASDDTEDDRVVWTVCKNSNGKEGPRSAWRRRNGLFERVDEFDWKEFDGGESKGLGSKAKVTEQHIRELFDFGSRSLKLGDAARELMRIAGVGKSAAYDALLLKDTDRTEARFARMLRYDDRTKMLSLLRDDPRQGEMKMDNPRE